MATFMMRWVMALVLAAGSVLASPIDGQATYEMLFREGTLDAVSRQSKLVYARDVTNALTPEAAERDTGSIALSIGESDSPLAELEFRKDSKSRKLGRFPASVGNPMIMYFYESVVRDMAASAGGSPFYIRNRMKNALIQPSELETGEAILDGETVPTQVVRLHPFEGDPNQDRMRGFGDLVLTVTMSEAVPGWYLSLVAEAGGSGESPVYKSELRFDRLEGSK